MKPINLRPHEARRLAEAGEVLVIRPVKPQPTDNGKMCRWVAADGAIAVWASGKDPADTGAASIVHHGPFGPPGTKVWGREPWWINDGWPPNRQRAALFRNPDGKTHTQVTTTDRCDSMHGCPDDGTLAAHGWSKRSAATMPRWASRFPSLVVASVRLCRLSGLTNDECRSHGIDDWLCKFDGRAYDIAEKAACRHTKRLDPTATCVTLQGVLCTAWDRGNPKHPAAGDPWVWAALVRTEDTP